MGDLLRDLRFVLRQLAHAGICYRCGTDPRAGHRSKHRRLAWVPLSTTGGVPARIRSEPEENKADMVSGNFFSGLGVPTASGRTFDSNDEQRHSQEHGLRMLYGMSWYILYH